MPFEGGIPRRQANCTFRLAQRGEWATHGISSVPITYVSSFGRQAVLYAVRLCKNEAGLVLIFSGHNIAWLRNYLRECIAQFYELMKALSFRRSSQRHDLCWPHPKLEECKNEQDNFRSPKIGLYSKYLTLGATAKELGWSNDLEAYSTPRQSRT